MITLGLFKQPVPVLYPKSRAPTVEALRCITLSGFHPSATLSEAHISLTELKTAAPSARSKTDDPTITMGRSQFLR